MKKIVYVFFIAAAGLFFAGCLKSGNQVTGPTGATGATGAPGANLPIPPITVLLNSGSMYHGGTGASLNWYDYTFQSYDSNYTYMLSVSFSRVGTKVWYPSPMTNVYAVGDELYANIGHDTIKILYYNPAASGFPDSSMYANISILAIPPPQNTIH